MATLPVIEIRGLTKVFRDFWRRPTVMAVDNLSATVEQGQVFGLLGPNGSGKSTTIKLLLGLLHPTQGTCRVLNGQPFDLNVRARIGYLPEASYLYRYLSARETLTFYGRLFDIPSKERRERVNQLLEMTGLTEAADRAVGEFSKGMARRLGLAQALINRPDLLILDEPTSGLDPIGCRQVKMLLRRLADNGTSILLTSHLLADVETICDRILILYAGKARAAGTLDELLEQREQQTFTVPALNADQMRLVLEALREHAGTEPEVSRPSIQLEQYFVDVIRDATGNDPAAGGGDPAPFLQARPVVDNTADARSTP